MSRIAFAFAVSWCGFESEYAGLLCAAAAILVQILELLVSKILNRSEFVLGTLHGLPVRTATWIASISQFCVFWIRKTIRM